MIELLLVIALTLCPIAAAAAMWAHMNESHYLTFGLVCVSVLGYFLVAKAIIENGVIVFM